MALDELTKIFLPAIESKLRGVISITRKSGLEDLHTMLSYHMGWKGEGAGPEARGKRIRPLMVLLTSASLSSKWKPALPAAVSVELVHNFSLIHDDIQDKSDLRRGRPALWTIWGIPQAINAGDTLFSLAQMALTELADSTTHEIAIKSSKILQETCIELTQGQYQDLAFENLDDLSIDLYWDMVSGKTASLMSASTQIGALCTNASEGRVSAFGRFGYSLGLAFQVQDDLLGIWGDVAMTGKSTESDLITRKKTLPIVFGLNQNKEFKKRWKKGAILAEEVSSVASLLEFEGAREFTEQQVTRFTNQALASLQEAEPSGLAGEALYEVSRRLIVRAS